MQLHVAFLPEETGDVSDSVCIVIDALRATTVIATLFARGCPRVYVAPDHDLARQFARERGYALCGETNGLRVEDFDYGNSPTEFAALDFTGRPIVLSTTNGTKATAAVAGARRVYLGAAINRRAVARAAWQRARESESNLCIVCAGTNGGFTLEDATVAGMYVEGLCAQAGAWEMPQLTDAAIAARRLWEAEPSLLRGWIEGNHARHLAESGFGDDLGYSAQADRLDCVPTLTNEDGAEAVSAPVHLVR
jgi:2-phosphosulfolactate phosphatase